MFQIFKKEINSFFSSLVGYIVLIIFLLAIGLFVWVFPESNVLDYGYASMDGFFYYTPFVFLFLIPAITMRSFAEEIKGGTIEILSTKPIGDLQIVLGKFFACIFIVIIALLPTLLYVYSINKLGSPPGNLDFGATWGSYIGLIFLSGGFVAIGIFASSLTGNQIVAFLSAVFLCFIFYSGFDSVSGIFESQATLIQSLGINYHFLSISRGVVDTRDAVYFISLIVLFILFTKVSLESRKW